MHIDHIVLWVSDPTASLEYYVNVIGLEPVRAEEFHAGSSPFPSVRISGHSILDLTPKVAAGAVKMFTGETKPSAAGDPINHLCLSMTLSELDALKARLEAARVTTTHMGTLSFGARGNTEHWFYFQDPDGNVIEARAYDDA
jgi:glyoxylase I family protein